MPFNKIFLYMKLNLPQYSMMIATQLSRSYLLRQHLALYALGQSIYLKKIYICWVDNHSFPGFDHYINKSKYHVPFELIPTVTGFITDRFRIPNSLKTETLLILDDDINVEWKDLDKAFSYYISGNFSFRIFGTFTRRFYKGKYLLPRCNQPYSIVLTGFSFLSRQLLEEYNKDKYKDLRNYCIKIRNCDDLLMNFIVQHTFHLPPQAIKISYKHIYTDGISTLPQHGNKRLKCWKHFTDFFGYDVLEQNLNNQTNKC